MVEIGKHEEADRDGARRVGRGADLRVRHMGGLCIGQGALAVIGEGYSTLPLPGLERLLAAAPEGLEDLPLHPQQPGFDRGRPTKSPEEGSQPPDELLLDRGLGEVLRENRRFEFPVLLEIFKGFDNGFGREPVAESIPAVCAPGTGALERVAAVRLDLPERSHGASDSTAAPWEAGPFSAACATWPSWALAPPAVVPGGIPEAGRWRVFFHNFRAILTESIPTPFHQAHLSP